MAANTARKPTPNIPYDAIRDLATRYSEVAIRICRKTNNIVSTLPGYESFPRSTIELAQIDQFIEGVAGGGTYIVHVFHPSDPTNELIPPFQVSIEGVPRPVRRPEALQAPAWAYGAPPAPPPPPLVPLPVGLPLEAYSAVAAAAPTSVGASVGATAPAPASAPDPATNGAPAAVPAGAPASGVGPTAPRAPAAVPPAAPPFPYGPPVGPTPWDWRYAWLMPPTLPMPLDPRWRPDLLGPGLGHGLHDSSKQEMKAMQEAVMALSAKFEAERRNYEREVQLAREKQYEQQLQQLREELRAAKEQRPPESKIDWSGLAAVVGAIVPLFAGRESTASKGLEMQAQMLAKTIELATGRQQPDSTKVAMELFERLLPLVQKSSEDAKTQAELFRVMAENQVKNISLMADLIEKFASDKVDDDHPVIDILKQAIDGAKQIAVAHFSASQAGNAATVDDAPMLGAPASAAASLPSGDTSTAPTYSAPPPPAPPTPTSPQKTPSATPDGLTQLLPEGFRTPEWKKLIATLHAPESTRLPAENLALYIARHIEHLITFDLLPPELASVRTAPRETLLRLVMFLPAYQSSRDYVERVVSIAADLLTRAGLAKPDATANGADEAEVETDDADEDDASAHAANGHAPESLIGEGEGAHEEP